MNGATTARASSNTPFATFPRDPKSPNVVKHQWVVEDEVKRRIGISNAEYTRAEMDEAAKKEGVKVLGVFIPAAPLDPLPKQITAADLKYGMTVYYRGENEARLICLIGGKTYFVDSGTGKSGNVFSSLNEAAEYFNGPKPLYTLEPRK